MSPSTKDLSLLYVAKPPETILLKSVKIVKVEEGKAAGIVDHDSKQSTVHLGILFDQIEVYCDISDLPCAYKFVPATRGTFVLFFETTAVDEVDDFIDVGGVKGVEFGLSNFGQNSGHLDHFTAKNRVGQGKNT